MNFVDLLCDTPIETIWIGSIRIQLVPKDDADVWWVFSWPKRFGELVKSADKWVGRRAGKQVVTDSDRYVVLGVLAMLA